MVVNPSDIPPATLITSAPVSPSIVKSVAEKSRSAFMPVVAASSPSPLLVVLMSVLLMRVMVILSSPLPPLITACKRGISPGLLKAFSISPMTISFPASVNAPVSLLKPVSLSSVTLKDGVCLMAISSTSSPSPISTVILFFTCSSSRVSSSSRAVPKYVTSSAPVTVTLFFRER